MYYPATLCCCNHRESASPGVEFGLWQVILTNRSHCVIHSHLSQEFLIVFKLRCREGVLGAYHLKVRCVSVINTLNSYCPIRSQRLLSAIMCFSFELEESRCTFGVRGWSILMGFSEYELKLWQQECFLNCRLEEALWSNKDLCFFLPSP